MPNQLTPLVSIITPTYNHERFIGACIGSVLQQTYHNWEQIVIDDGSTDCTSETVRSFGDPRIHYIHQKNRGIEALAHTYNRALAYCAGELIAILEGDDLWPATKLAAMVPAFADDNVVLAYGAVADISAAGNWSGRIPRAVRLRKTLPESVLFNNPVGSAARYMLRADGADLIPPSTAMVRRSTIDAIGGFRYVSGICVTDFPTFMNLSLRGKFNYSPEVMGYRRRHRLSATVQKRSEIMIGVRNYAERFRREQNIGLTAEDRRIIDKTWRSSACDAEFSAGRVSLLDGHWHQARQHFRGAINLSLPRLSLAAFLGWVVSWLHRDLESLLSAVGIATMQSGNMAADLSE